MPTRPHKKILRRALLWVVGPIVVAAIIIISASATSSYASLWFAIQLHKLLPVASSSSSPSFHSIFGFSTPSVPGESPSSAGISQTQTFGQTVTPTIEPTVIITAATSSRPTVSGSQQAAALPVTTPSRPLSGGSETTPNNPVITSQPSTSPTFNGSFTELFSGNGWSDSGTTAYEDYSATEISLVPDFTVTASDFVPDPNSTPGATNSSLTGTVSQSGGNYVANIPAYPNFSITSPYQGVLRFGYDPDSKKTLVIYAAYVSQVFQINPDGSVENYSSRFSQRAFGGYSAGSLAVYPSVFYQDGAWWISSGEGSTQPKLLKIVDGAVVDYTNSFQNETLLQAWPGPSSHSVYVVGSQSTYLLKDNGFKHAAVAWVSTRINEADGTVKNALISTSSDSDHISASGEPTGLISYFFSNDGGSTWNAAMPNQVLSFPSSGGDLRFKIVLTPASDKYLTPWVDNFGVQYNIQK